MADRPRIAHVCAIVLTFNRLEKLRRCLDALERQTAVPGTVLVVDNHSSDGTALYLNALAAEGSVTVVTAEENLGPAGGYALGMTWAVEQDAYDYLWVMDDDCFPDPTCLEVQLRTARQNRRSTIFPQSVDVGTNAPTGNRSGWIGVLIPMDEVRLAGVPDKELFFGSEDAEYLIWRLEKVHGVQRILEPKAVIRFDRYHESARAPWRYYYKVRNAIYYRRVVQRTLPRTVRYGMMFRWLVASWVLALLRGDQKLKALRYLMLATLHGFQGRLGKTIDPRDS